MVAKPYVTQQKTFKRFDKWNRCTVAKLIDYYYPLLSLQIVMIQISFNMWINNVQYQPDVLCLIKWRRVWN